MHTEPFMSKGTFKKPFITLVAKQQFFYFALLFPQFCDSFSYMQGYSKTSSSLSVYNDTLGLFARR